MASLSLVATPLLTTNIVSAAGTVSRATKNETVIVDLTNDQSYYFTGSYAKQLISRIHDENANTQYPDDPEYCSYVVNNEFTGHDGDDEKDPYLCFKIMNETEGEESVELYNDWLAFDTVLNTKPFLFAYDTIEGGNNSGVGSDVILVGDPNDLDHAYTGTSDITIVTHVVSLDIYYGEGYAMIDGDGQTWTKGSEDDLTFHATGSFESDYSGILVDGEEIDEAYHQDSAGSVIVTLLSNYLNTLSVGSHTLTIQYNGGELEANFTVQENPDTLDSVKVATTGLMASIVVLFAVASYGILAKRR